MPHRKPLQPTSTIPETQTWEGCHIIGVAVTELGMNYIISQQLMGRLSVTKKALVIFVMMPLLEREKIQQLNLLAWIGITTSMDRQFMLDKHNKSP